MIRTIAKRLGTLLFCPFLVLLLPSIALGIGIICVSATVSGLLKRARWLRRLRREGRASPAAILLSNISGGTLIVDRPGFNFKSTHCWWTNENVAEISPVPMPTDGERLELCAETKEMTPHEFDLWCWHRYLSPHTGSATLVAPAHHGEAMAAKMRERLPGLGLVLTWSAIPAMQSLATKATEP